ncbi:hypothetical protein AHQ64_22345 [Salmonella enterica subsp. enterica]|nr:hypothetical protein [Salmonella enterica subsp. enterica]
MSQMKYTLLLAVMAVTGNLTSLSVHTSPVEASSSLNVGKAATVYHILTQVKAQLSEGAVAENTALAKGVSGERHSGP